MEERQDGGIGGELNAEGLDIGLPTMSEHQCKILTQGKMNIINFICDSGATKHMCKNKYVFSNLRKCASEIAGANKESKTNIKVEWKGVLRGKVNCNRRKKN